MAANKKCDVIGKELVDRLKRRTSYKSATIATSFNSTGETLVQIGTLGAGTVTALIRIVNVDWPLAKDALGLTAGSYGPNKIQLATEANEAGVADNEADILNRQQLIDLLGEILAAGCDVEWYEEANGTPAAESTITGSKLKATFQASSVWAFSGQ